MWSKAKLLSTSLSEALHSEKFHPFDRVTSRISSTLRHASICSFFDRYVGAPSTCPCVVKKSKPSAVSASVRGIVSSSAGGVGFSSHEGNDRIATHFSRAQDLHRVNLHLRRAFPSSATASALLDGGFHCKSLPAIGAPSPKIIPGSMLGAPAPKV